MRGRCTIHVYRYRGRRRPGVRADGRFAFARFVAASEGRAKSELQHARLVDERSVSGSAAGSWRCSRDVTAAAVEPAKRLVVEWPAYGGRTTVEWSFTPYDGGTFVAITQSGFTGDGDALVKQVADSTQGFALVLAGLKAYLEHGVRLNLVADRFPKGLEEHQL